MIFGQDIVEVLDLSRVVEAYLKIELTLRRKNMLFQWKKKERRKKEGRKGGGREEGRKIGGRRELSRCTKLSPSRNF